MNNTSEKNKLFLPVIHHLKYDLSVQQAEFALTHGADGIFLISHNGDDDQLEQPTRDIKQRFPTKLIGINLLSKDALSSLQIAKNWQLDMVWTDGSGVSSRGATDLATKVAEELQNACKDVMFFGSVAFKYQRPEPDPAKAAQLALQLGMIPTTSGPGTGEAPTVDKIKSIHMHNIDGPLAIASGMTVENIQEFLPFASHFLVATGICVDFYRFDESKLVRMAEIIHQA